MTSPNGALVAISQGWSRVCGILETGNPDQEPKKYTEPHTGFIKMVQFNHDGSCLYVLDHGHCGTYDVRTFTDNYHLLQTHLFTLPFPPSFLV
jgi:hypothetical protein